MKTPQQQIPTDEQVKEFWEGCGLYWNGYYWFVRGKDGCNNICTGKKLPIDLNNLFKYAVPKLYEKGYHYEMLQWNSGLHKVYLKKIAEPSVWATSISDGLDRDPALALFWAIWEVTHG